MFKGMPQLEGQVVHWFVIEVPSLHTLHTTASELDDVIKPTTFELTMSYKQKLSNGKFIYTPLIPQQKQGHDYGFISLAAGRPLELLNADKHKSEHKDGKIIVKPSHMGGIVVQVALEGDKVP